MVIDLGAPISPAAAPLSRTAFRYPSGLVNAPRLSWFSTMYPAVGDVTALFAAEPTPAARFCAMLSGSTLLNAALAAVPTGDVNLPSGSPMTPPTAPVAAALPSWPRSKLSRLPVAMLMPCVAALTTASSNASLPTSIPRWVRPLTARDNPLDATRPVIDVIIETSRPATPRARPIARKPPPGSSDRAPNSTALTPISTQTLIFASLTCCPYSCTPSPRPRIACASCR